MWTMRKRSTIKKEEKKKIEFTKISYENLKTEIRAIVIIKTMNIICIDGRY